MRTTRQAEDRVEARADRDRPTLAHEQRRRPKVASSARDDRLRRRMVDLGQARRPAAQVSTVVVTPGGATSAT
jgi:hypothetical protein